MEFFLFVLSDLASLALIVRVRCRTFKYQYGLDRILDVDLVFAVADCKVKSRSCSPFCYTSESDCWKRAWMMIWRRGSCRAESSRVPRGFFGCHVAFSYEKTERHCRPEGGVRRLRKSRGQERRALQIQHLGSIDRDYYHQPTNPEADQSVIQGSIAAGELSLQQQQELHASAARLPSAYYAHFRLIRRTSSSQQVVEAGTPPKTVLPSVSDPHFLRRDLQCRKGAESYRALLHHRNAQRTCSPFTSPIRSIAALAGPAPTSQRRTSSG